MTELLYLPDWFGYHEKLVRAVVFGCKLSSTFCDWASGLLLNPEIDNTDRFTTLISNEPNGSSYLTFAYEAQQLLTDQWYLYDYGDFATNMYKYGSQEAPLVPIDDIKVPIALISGDVDNLARPSDVAWLSQRLGDKVIF